MLQYAGRGIWGNLKDGTEILPEFVENMGFTSYRYDPVTGKHFAHARFYDDANGRMLAPDPVRRDLNGYRYCGNDPVDYVDPTGEIGILGRTVIGGALGAVIGGAGGFISSAVSQKLGGGKVDWKKAKGEAIKGAITGAVQGGMVASGVKIPKAAANAANFLAGTIGSAAEQKFARGRVSAGRSILGGLANMAGNSKYGTGKLDNWKDAAVRGVKAGGLYAGLGYLADVVDPAPRLDAAGAAGLMAGMAGSLLVRNPGRCGSPSPFQTMLGYGMAKGYRYGVSQTGFGNRKRPSFTGFLCEGLRGAVTGGVSSVAFYGLNKGIVKLWDGFWAGKDSRVTINNQADFVVAPGGVAYTAADYAKMSSFECPSTLYHYTTKTGMRGILESQQINPSIKELAVKDARMGSGQYLTDIIPGSRTKGQISYALFGIPWNTRKVSNYIEISTSNLNLLKGREGIYYVPSTSALDLTNRIISYGETGKGG